MAISNFNVLTLPMVGASLSENGVSGLVPAPASGDQDKFLKGNGAWDQISPMIGASSTADGAIGGVPVPHSGDQDKVLKGDGTWGVFTGTNMVSYDLDLVSNVSGYYTHTTTAAGVTADMKAVRLDMGNPAAFVDDVIITTGEGTITLSCNSVVGVSTVNVSLMFDGNIARNDLIREKNECLDEIQQAIQNATLSEQEGLELIDAAIIRAQMEHEVSTVSGVTKCRAYVNLKVYESEEHILSHDCVSVYVLGGLTTQIAKAVAENLPEEMATSGTVNANVRINGVSKTIKISRATQKTVTMVVSIIPIREIDTSVLTDVRSAILDYVNKLQIGFGIYASDIEKIIMATIEDCPFEISNIAITVDNVESNYGHDGAYNVLYIAQASDIQITEVST